MPLDTNIQQGDPNHPGIHNAERQAINDLETALDGKAATGHTHSDIGGVTDHNELSGRTASGQHPIGAISNLGTQLDGKVNRSSGIVVVSYGTNVNTTRPSGANTVYWKGSQGAGDPVNASVGDLVFVPDPA